MSNSGVDDKSAVDGAAAAAADIVDSKNAHG